MPRPESGIPNLGEAHRRSRSARNRRSGHRSGPDRTLPFGRKLSNQQPTASSRQAGVRSILLRNQMAIGTVVKPPPTLNGTVVKPCESLNGTVVKPCESPNGTVVNPLKTPNGTDPNAHATPRTTPPAFATTRARRRTISEPRRQPYPEQKCTVRVGRPAA